MATIIIFVVIGIISGIYKGMDEGDFEIGIILSLIRALLGGLFGFLVAISLPCKMETVKTTLQLESLQDNGSVEGSFFLGSGQIDGTMKYVFYYKYGEYYKLGQADYKYVSVKYSNENPKVEIFTRKEVDGAFINNFAVDLGKEPMYIIYVPKGSIKQGFTLDAQ